VTMSREALSRPGNQQSPALGAPRAPVPGTALYALLGRSDNVHSVHGNIGPADSRGARRLLHRLRMLRVSVRDIRHLIGTALITGGGAWCPAFHAVLPYALPQLSNDSSA